MKWENGQPVFMCNQMHKFVNADGVTINSNIRNIKTSFRYLGIATNYKKFEKLFSIVDSALLSQIKIESKTDIEYESKLFTEFILLTSKTDPQGFLGKYAATKHIPAIVSNLSKDSFLYIFRSNKHNVLDWDVEINSRGPNYIVKFEILLNYKKYDRDSKPSF